MPRRTAVDRLRQAGVNIELDDTEISLEEFILVLMLQALLQIKRDIRDIAVAVGRVGGPSVSDRQNMADIVSRGLLPNGRGD